MKASAAQHAMWLNERLGIAGAVYHMPMSIVFTGPLDRDRMAHACLKVVAQHPILGCAFEERDEQLHIYRARRRPWVSFEPADAPDAPFDLENGPLIRFHLTPDGPDRHLLHVVAHHLVFDGQSKDLFLRDLAAAYNSGGSGRLTAPPPPPQDTPMRTPVGDAPAPAWSDVTLPGLRAVSARALPGECVDFTVTQTRAGLTRFELLLSTLFELLFRYGNADPTVAIDLGTRRREDRDCIGLYVNELPLQAAPQSVLARLRDLYRLRNVELQGNPRLALAPVSISYRRRGPVPPFAGLEAEVEWMGFHGWARNALHVQVVDDGREARVRFQYAPSQLRREDVQRMAAHFQNLLAGDPARPMLVPGELTGLTGAAMPVPPGHIDEQITGTGIAVTGSGFDLTYAGLVAAAEDIAVALRDRGVRPGDRVAVRMRRTPELLAALLGVWKAGAAYVPLDPDYPPARQSLLLSDARPRAVLTQDGVVGLEWSGTSNPGLAYVIYTSGSTGRPKGVAVGHDSLSNLLAGLRHCLDIPPRPVFLAVASFAFDMSIPELWLPLVMGGTVVLATEDEARDAERLLKLIRTKGVTHVHVTPSTWQRLLEAGFDEPGVVAISGAEALPEPIARQIRGRSARLWNLYGPTETTVWSTYSEVDDGPVTIGRPLPNTTVTVVDDSLSPVPQGIPGELCIGGAGVARGYFGQPELTAQRFVNGAYRTGDRVRLRHDGSLEWIGRFDNQIKLRGYRVELGEIEARLLEHPGIRSAAAMTHDGETLVAYVVGDATDLREHMAEVLPAHQVPTKYVFLPELPLNANGKLDRSRLPEPEPDSTSDGYTGVAEQIYRIWCEVLGRKDIGPDDDLFDLGGHSLTVTKIAARMRRHLGIDLPLHIFFDTPTISALAAASQTRGT
ncbi:amino acid adenylation domain-containing protein [Allorhizocola rhizosphaerae]|uniref:non-ribosomal peptide synthetase family protein n=1 Tax=Allorhizocola rhizosphaerae TaxID=1872709 RepID=UPI000E3CFB26|nr:amino acid adenylation domain-containing protein [Allorhizocola rhizosphaerae]